MADDPPRTTSPTTTAAKLRREFVNLIVSPIALGRCTVVELKSRSLRFVQLHVPRPCPHIPQPLLQAVTPFPVRPLRRRANRRLHRRLKLRLSHGNRRANYQKNGDEFSHLP